MQMMTMMIGKVELRVSSADCDVFRTEELQKVCLSQSTFGTDAISSPELFQEVVHYVNGGNALYLARSPWASIVPLTKRNHLWAWE